ncbi:hypothetical protein QUF64_15440 [Anaerolineales bacterium HSG6]|nr:hypothetical protein [Anaerolineales bacterium HSG6]
MSRKKKNSKRKTASGIGILNDAGTFVHEPSSEAALSEKTAAYLRERYPDILFNIDVLAGINLSVQQGARAKKQGKTKSWPDVFIAVARQGYHGLFIEQKKHGERIVQVNNQQKYTSKHVTAQAEMLQRLRDEGYCAEFAVGFAETQEVIDWYLGEEKE